MKISRDWLQKYFHAPLPPAGELGDALTFHAFEIDGIEEHGTDHVLDVKVTPNRGHDALSYRGIAKEVSAILQVPLTSDPFSDSPQLEPTTDKVSVHIEDVDLCPRYVAGYIRGVKVGPSPEWLQNRLAAMGSRSVNNVVDATNFVMFNLGQPLHAFDAAKLQETNGRYAIEVRCARDGEKLMSLDKKEYELEKSHLVIADKHADVPVGIAGIKGGLPAGVSEETTDIIIESANFDGVSVRRTARALNLRTDASARYEQVLSPELCGFGMRSVVDLILKIAGGDLVGFADAYPKPKILAPVSVTAAHAERLLGITITDEIVRKVFRRLGFSFVEKAREFIVQPPFERLDLHIPEDLIEEIGRIVGYESVEARELAEMADVPKVNPHFYTAEKVREYLMSRGFSEVYTSVFVNDGKRTVLNKVDGERPHLRGTLHDGLAAALERNDRIKEAVGMRDVRLFEIGTVWHENHEEIRVALGVLGGKKALKPGMVLAEMAQALGVESPAPVEGKSIVEVPLESLVPATIPTAYDELLPSQTERVQPFSRFPFIVRDIALWVPEGTHTTEVQKIIADAAGPLMLRIDLFDEFTKEGKTSYAYRLVFQSLDRTLTDSEAQAAMEAVYAAVAPFDWTVR